MLSCDMVQNPRPKAEQEQEHKSLNLEMQASVFNWVGFTFTPSSAVRAQKCTK